MNAPLRHVNLNDKYALSSGRVYLTGTQALVRLLLLQHQRDVLAGINTGGFVSGYRGSPLGSVDQALFSAKSHLTKSGVVFQPGINEDLAATAVWGTQQVNLHPGAKVDGVYAMWYGKGPGVDRSGDVFRMPMPLAAVNTAACWSSPAMITLRNRRPCHIRLITFSNR